MRFLITKYNILDNMKVILYLLLVNILAYTESSKPKTVSLAVETILEFNNNDQAINVDFIDDIQNVLDKVKNVIGPNLTRNGNKVLSNKQLKFTDFLENAIIILQKYNDDDLQKVFDILDDEIHKYHYEGCKFHELTEKYSIRRFISDKLEEVKKTPPLKVRRGLEVILNTLQQRKYNEKHSDIINLLNSLYGKESTHKLATLLNNLQEYNSKTKRSYVDLLSVVKDGIRSVIFDHYSNLNNNVRKKLKLELESYWTDHFNNKIEHKVIRFGAGTVKIDNNDIYLVDLTSPITVKPIGYELYNIKKREPRITKESKPIKKEHTIKERERNKKEHHRSRKNKLTTEGIYEKINIRKDLDTIMTLYPEKIKKRKHKASTPVFKSRSHKKGREKKQKNLQPLREERSTKKPKHYFKHSTVISAEKQSVQDEFDKNIDKIKNTKIQKSKNLKTIFYRNDNGKGGKDTQSNEGDSITDVDRPKVKHIKKNNQNSRKRVSEKSTYENNKKLTTFRNYDRNEYSSSENSQNLMIFRNMDIESNEGMSIEGFYATPIENIISYRKFNSNNTFGENQTNEKDIRASVMNRGIIQRIDNLEKQLQDVKSKIENQQNNKYLNIANLETVKDKNINVTPKLDSIDGQDNDSSSNEPDNSAEKTTSSKKTSVTIEPKKAKIIISTSSSKITTKPTVKSTTYSTTLKTTMMKKDTTPMEKIRDIILKEPNETRREKPKIVIKKTKDYFRISENLMNSTMSSIPLNVNDNLRKHFVNRTYEQLSKQNTNDNETNLRKTGASLDANIDEIFNNNKTTTPKEVMTALELQKELFNDSTILHEDKEKDRLIKQKLQQDLRRIFDNEEEKIDFGLLPSEDIHNNSLLKNKGRRRNMGSASGKGMGDSFSQKFDIDDLKDPFSGDFDGL